MPYMHLSVQTPNIQNYDPMIYRLDAILSIEAKVILFMQHHF